MQEPLTERKETWRPEPAAAVTAAAVAVWMRVLPHWPNFTPVGALGLFGGARLRLWQAAALTLAVMAASDLLLWGWLGLTPFNPFVYGCLLLNVLWGRLLLRRATPVRVTAAALATSGQFFLVTNFGVWLTGTMYPHTAAGLGLCYLEALAFIGTWNVLLADLLFCAVLFGACALVPAFARRKASQPA